MSKKRSAKAASLQKLTQTEQILRLTLSGYQPTEIAETLGIQRTYVQQALDDALASVSEAVIEKSDRLAVINIARLEEVITHLHDPALGIAPEWADDEYMRDNPNQFYPDHRLLRMYLDAMKLEIEISKFIAGVDTDHNKQNINVEHMEVTFTGTNPLYQKAKEDMQAEWMGYADDEIIDLIAPTEEEAENEERVRMALPDQETRLREIESRMPEDTDDDEEEK